MTTRILRSWADIPKLAAFLELLKFPCVVTVTVGDSRREAQNRLAQRWFADVARQLGDVTHAEVRADCKVTFGVPILCAENDAFRESWSRTFGALDYAAQRDAVRVLDVPVTRLMTVKQMTAFMDAVHRHYTPRGVRLTDPEAMKYETEFA
jgi:hypothetical protein